uniref:Uncharacterized protein n=1 Tax=Lygus hesperus TaxID=30085 RepID=A0A0A9X7L9_LYGHE
MTGNKIKHTITFNTSSISDDSHHHHHNNTVVVAEDHCGDVNNDMTAAVATEDSYLFADTPSKSLRENLKGRGKDLNRHTAPAAKLVKAHGKTVQRKRQLL